MYRRLINYTKFDLKTIIFTKLLCYIPTYINITFAGTGDSFFPTNTISPTIVTHKSEFSIKFSYKVVLKLIIIVTFL